MYNFIMIDAGHCLSGGDTGARGNGYKEEVLTREVAYKLGDILKAQGIKIAYAQIDKSSSLNESLNYRTSMENKLRPDIYVSIHINAFDGTAHGTETLIYGPGGDAEKAAKRVQPKVVAAIGTTDRGIKSRPGLAVLRKTIGPAILVECCFIDNSSDMNKFDSSKIAKAIAEGLLNKSITTDSKPVADSLYRVSVDGTQVGAYKETKNVLSATEDALKSNKSKIEINKK